jgi:hypothetical protein
MVAMAARMDLQHQPVFQAHARHFGEHVPAEGIRFLRGAQTLQCLGKKRRRLVGG